MMTPLHWSRRRRWLIGIIAACLLIYLMLWHARMAITQVASLKELDWNGDQVTSFSEIVQAVYAVKVNSSTHDNRACREFVWRQTHERLRIVCQTIVHSAPDTDTRTPAKGH